MTVGIHHYEFGHRAFVDPDGITLGVVDSALLDMMLDNASAAVVLAHYDVVFVRGAPGAGKSTLAKKIQNIVGARNSSIYETDDYWIRPDGFYDFNFKRLSEAHEWNFNRFVHDVVIDGYASIPIVSNTSIKANQMAEYIRCMKENVNILVVECHNDYGSIHSVPEETVTRMKQNFETSDDDYVRLIQLVKASRQ